MRRVRHESCLCKYCENFTCYVEALDNVMKELREVYEPSDVDEPEELDPIAMDVNYKKMRQFGETDRRIDKVKLLLCTNAFHSEKRDCIEGVCDSCGFKRIWSSGLREKLVDKEGNLKSGIHPVWLKEVQWWRYKTSAPSNSVAVDDTNADKETLKQHRKGSIIEFLDEFEAHTWKKYPSHRFTLHKTREAANELHQNARPGTLRTDRDWSERYTMIDAREIQSGAGGWSSRRPVSSLASPGCGHMGVGSMVRASENVLPCVTRFAEFDDSQHFLLEFHLLVSIFQDGVATDCHG